VTPNSWVLMSSSKFKRSVDRRSFRPSRRSLSMVWRLTASSRSRTSFSCWEMSFSRSASSTSQALISPSTSASSAFLRTSSLDTFSS
jgi:hypothetical protein